MSGRIMTRMTTDVDALDTFSYAALWAAFAGDAELVA